MMRMMASNRGSLLIVTLWAVAFFALVAGSLTLRAQQQIALTKREMGAFRDKIDFGSGLSLAVKRIDDDDNPRVDAPDEAWHGAFSPEGLKDFSATLEDEESRLNLNLASGAFLAAFFRRFDEEAETLAGPRKDYAQKIIELRQAGRLQSLEELLQVEDFAPEDLEKIRPFVTVYPDRPLVNVNTASLLVLNALIDSLGADTSAKRTLQERLGEFKREDGIFREEDLTPQAFSELLRLPQTPLQLQAAQELTVNLTTDSQTFRLIERTARGSVAQSVFAFRPGQLRPEVHWWHETSV